MDSVTGVQYAGISNVAKGKVTGLQGSGIYNHVGNSLRVHSWQVLPILPGER